jgi:hypothetical protein
VILVAECTRSGALTAAQRAGSSVHDLGRYGSRSISARPLPLAWPRNVVTWLFSIRPAVPVYCRCTATVAGARLQVTGVVDDQHTVRFAELLHDVRAQLVTHRIGVPHRLG